MYNSDAAGDEEDSILEQQQQFNKKMRDLTVGYLNEFFILIRLIYIYYAFLRLLLETKY